MAYEEFIAEFSNEDLRELAGFLNRNEVSARLEAQLRAAIEATSMEQRQAAFEDKPNIVDLLTALGLDFEFPDGDLARPEEEDVGPIDIEEAEPEPEPAPETAPDRGVAGPEALQPGARPREGVQPGEEVIRDESRISGEPIRRDLGLERAFLELMRDVGRGRQFNVFQPDIYFRLTPDEQRRFFDFTVQEALQWLVRRREITPEQLRARGFPDELIP